MFIKTLLKIAPFFHSALHAASVQVASGPHVCSVSERLI